MQKIRIIAVGSLKEAYFREAVAEYMKRLSSFCKPEIIEIPEARLPENPSEGDIKAALDKEAVRINDAIPQGFDIAVLTPEGNRISSERFAALISTSAVSGKPGIAFIIGGSHGIAAEIKVRASYKISFSDMTFPHQLFRVMLAEQLYRAFSINAGTKYHK